MRFHPLNLLVISGELFYSLLMKGQETYEYRDQQGSANTCRYFFTAFTQTLLNSLSTIQIDEYNDT